MSNNNTFFSQTENDLYRHDHIYGEPTFYPQICTVFIDESFPLNSSNNVSYRIDQIEVAVDRELELPTEYPSLKPCAVNCILSKNRTITAPVTREGHLMKVDFAAAGIPAQDRHIPLKMTLILA